MKIKRIPNLHGGNGPMPSIGVSIRQAREECGLSQKELSEMLGFESGTALSLIESDKRSVDAKKLWKISLITGVSIQSLFHGWV